jgi:arginase
MPGKASIIGVPMDLGADRRGVDMDAIDPAHAPGVGTPVRGGFSYREAHLALEMIADSGRLLSLEVVETNPVIDLSNSTAQLGVELVLSALGKKIL